MRLPRLQTDILFVGISVILAVTAGGATTFGLYNDSYQKPSLAAPKQLGSMVLPSATAPPSPSPTVTPTPTATPVATAKPKRRVATPAGGSASAGAKLGFAVGSTLAQLSPAEQNRQLDEMKALGVGWVRFDIEWNNIEQAGPGRYNWADYDRLVSASTSRGLKVLGILDYSPPWARLPECAGSSACAPANPDDYARFAGAAAAHYRGLGVHHWEIWNEPNSPNFFKPAADPARYTQMLIGAYVSIKAANPGATVITAGLAPADTAGGFMSPVDFAHGIYGNGGGGRFDAFGIHPSTYPVTAAYPNPNNVWGQMTVIYNLMASRGDGGKKIWITEYGAPTGGPGIVANENAYNGADHVTERLQAQMVNDVFAQHRTKPWLGPLFWYNYQDHSTDPSTIENFFGLVRPDGSKKPAYSVFQTLARTF